MGWEVGCSWYGPKLGSPALGLPVRLLGQAQRAMELRPVISGTPRRAVDLGIQRFHPLVLLRKELNAPAPSTSRSPAVRTHPCQPAQFGGVLAGGLKTERP